MTAKRTPKQVANANRLKGTRQEYRLRNHFREEGYISHRVPSSGSAHGFPGDVSFKDENDVLRLAELKSRKDHFNVVYDWFHSFVDDGTLLEHMLDTVRIEYAFEFGGKVVVARTAKVLFEGAATVLANEKPHMTRKFLALEPWAEKVHVLVLHKNREPFLFLRYYEENHE